MAVDRSPGEWNLALRQQAALARLGQVGLSTNDLERVVTEAMVVVAETLGVREVAIFELLDSGSELAIRWAIHRGATVEADRLAEVRVPAGSNSLPGFAVFEGRPVVVEDLFADPRFRVAAQEQGFEVRSAIAAPIGWEQPPFGVLAAYDVVLRRWTEDEAHFVWSVASTVGLAIQRARIEAELRDSNARLELSLQREQEARLEAETARERLVFLSEATAVLGTSLDPEVTLQRLADLCVPDLAEVCFIDLIDDDGQFVEHAARAVSAELLRNVRQIRGHLSEISEEGSGVPSVGHQRALEGRPVRYSEVTDQQMVDAAADGEHLELLRRVDARTTVLAPLIARGRPAGVLTLFRTGDAPPYEDEDEAFIQELAARAAMALDNGRLFRSRYRVARSLQKALLPPALPSVEGLALAARYDVAEIDVAIGGDFYDIIALDPSAWGVVVGDVCGRGPDAAALTGLVRHTVRTSVVHEDVPSRVLQQTNTAVLHQIDDASFCTAVYLRVELDDPRSGRVRVVASSAGHPRPVLVRAAGTAEVLDCAGTLLGVVPEPTLVDVEVELGPGDALVLYTDGVTEARCDHELFGEQRLLDAVAALAGRHADEIASGLQAAVAEFRTRASDDSAIVVLQSTGSAMMQP